MKHISAQNLKQCLKIMDELCKYRTASIYMNPVDPSRDNCPDYFDIISNPMDLSTVRLKLTSNSYTTISEWKQDVNLIFNNSKLYNSKDSLFGLTAQFLQKKFNDMVKYFSDDGWSKRIDYLQKQIQYLVQNTPNSLPQPYLSIEEIELKRSQLSQIETISRKVSHKIVNVVQNEVGATSRKANQNSVNNDSNHFNVINTNKNANKNIITKKISISDQSSLKIVKPNSNSISNAQYATSNSNSSYKTINNEITKNPIKKINAFDQDALQISDKSINRNNGDTNSKYLNPIHYDYIKDDNRIKVTFPNPTEFNSVGISNGNGKVNDVGNGNASMRLPNQNYNNYDLPYANNSKHMQRNNNTTNSNSDFRKTISNNNISNHNPNSVNNDSNNYRNRNTRNNNDSDSSDNIFILDD